MAEQVQAVLDGMVPALVDLQERQVFSHDEIRATVARRRDSEYLLRRRQPRKADFLRYLRQEMALERLRQLRVRRLRQESRERGEQQHQSAGGGDDDDTNKKPSAAAAAAAADDGNNTRHIGDRHIVQHLHRLWARTLRKFRADAALYEQYAEFCRDTNSHRRLAQCYRDALRYHPHRIQFWLGAASHEFFDGGGSVQSARILLQRGLRLHPAARDLWAQALALELHHVQKLRGRRAVLLGTSSSVVVEESSESGARAAEKTDGGAVSEQHKLAKLVYDHAIRQQQKSSSSSNNNKDNNNSAAAAADDLQLRLQMLEQCRLFPGTRDLQDHIVATIRRDFSSASDSAPSAWIARAVYAAQQRQQQQQPAHGSRTQPKGDDDSSAEPETKRQKVDDGAADPVLDIIRDASRAVKSEEMVLQAVRFLQSHARSRRSRHGGSDEEDAGEEKGSSHEDDEDDDESKDGFDDSKAAALAHEILQEAASSDYYTPALALLHAEFLEQVQDDIDGAIQVLQAYIDDDHQSKTATAAIWIRLANLRFNNNNSEQDEDEKDKNAAACIRLFERALHQFPMHEADHMRILLQLFGARLALEDIDNGGGRQPLAELFQRILLLAPGFSELEDMDDSISFCNVVNVPMACLQYLRFTLVNGDDDDHNDNDSASVGNLAIDRARTICDAVLLKSTCLDRLTTLDPEAMKAFVDEAIEAELTVAAAQKNKNRKRLGRLYESAIQMFRGTPLAADYKEQRDEQVRYSVSSTSRRHSQKDAAFMIPTIDMKRPNYDSNFIESTYKNFQIMHFRNAKSVKAAAERDDGSPRLRWEDLAEIFEKLDDKDKESWCIETKGAKNKLLASEFLNIKTSRKNRAYCSFLIQNDKAMYAKVLDSLPFREIPSTEWNYQPALWVFFGRNPLGNMLLDGRPDHTDSVTHDGTFHFQLSGEKQWSLRPSRELVSHVNEHFPAMQFAEDTRLRLACKEGDVIVINTRLWFHCTTIPPQAQPSVSYARDFRFEKLQSLTESQIGGMKNVDGLYATNDIAEGTIIFTEDSMPDCELHRSTTNPNCEVVELENGTSAVVSKRAIAAGEFFCVAESSNEDSYGASDEENFDNKK